MEQDFGNRERVCDGCGELARGVKDFRVHFPAVYVSPAAATMDAAYCAECALLAPLNLSDDESVRVEAL